MSFGNPLFLWSLLLISIPVLIHLFRFRKYKRIVFTQTFLFEQIQSEQKRLKNLRHILILSVRILTLSALVAAFSLPYFNKENKISPEKRTNRNIVLFIDNHLGFYFSENKGKSRINQLKSDALDLINQLGYFNRISILTNSSESEFFYNKEDAIRFILSIDPMLKVPDWDDISKKIEKHIRNESEKPEIFIISDFLKRKDDIQVISQSFRPLVVSSLDLMDLAFIDSVWSDFGTNTFVALVSQRGKNKSFILGHQKRIVFSLQSIEEEDGRLSFTVPASSGEPYFFIEPENNINPLLKFYFTNEVKDRPKVLVLSDKDRVSEALKGKFSDMQTADVDYVDLSGFSPVDILKYKTVILLNLREIPDRLSAQLHALLEQNGRILVLPPEKADLISYNRFLQSYDSKLLPPENILVNTDKIEYKDMLFDGVFLEEVPLPDLPYFNQIYPLESRSYRRVLYTISDQTVLANIQTNSAGYLYLFTTPIDPMHSNLVYHTVFNPLMYNFIHRNRSFSNLYYLAGREHYFTFSPDSLNRKELIKILTPSGEEVIPYQQIKGKDIIVYFGKDITQNGIYTFLYSGSVVGKSAFNVDVRSLQQGVYTTEELAERLSIDQRSIYPISDFRESLSVMEHNSSELWYPLVILAVLFFISEILIIRFVK